MENISRIDELLEKAEWAPRFSIEKSDILAQALKLAESENNHDKIYTIKNDYVECLVFQGRQDLAMPHFAWMLSQMDRKDKEMSSWEKRSLLWRYKWFAGVMPSYLNLSKQQIINSLEDMSSRFLANEPTSQDTVYDYKRRIYTDLGELDEARKYAQLFQESKSALSSFFGLGDCSTCVLHRYVMDLIWSGEFEKALEQAKPILEGTMTCASKPKDTYPLVVFANCLLGNMDEAQKYYKKGYKLLVAGNQELESFSMMMIYLAKAGKFDKAVEIFHLQFPQTLLTYNQRAIFEFYHAALYLFESILSKKKGVVSTFLNSLSSKKKTSIKLQLPDNELLFSESGEYELEDLCSFFATKTEAIATKFDARNGNDYYGRVLTGIYKKLIG